MGGRTINPLENYSKSTIVYFADGDGDDDGDGGVDGGAAAALPGSRVVRACFSAMATTAAASQTGSPTTPSPGG